MRLALPILVGTLLVAIPSLAPAAKQSDDETHTRGLFIGSRPERRTPSSRQPKSAHKTPNVTAPGTHEGAELVGLGFSVFRLVGNHSVRADPTSTFHEGTELRFVVEPSIDGYLYIFVATDAGPPVMIFPDSRLADGDNFLFAHAVTEVPSRSNARFDRFKLVDSPATERFYIVVSRAPLAGIPIASDLVALCARAEEACPWRPSQAAWDDIAKEESSSVHVSAIQDAGKPISPREEEALSRNVILASGDNQPSVVAMCSSAADAVLVRTVTIHHVK